MDRNYCAICNQNYVSKSSLQKHTLSKKHRDNTFQKTFSTTNKTTLKLTERCYIFIKWCLVQNFDIPRDIIWMIFHLIQKKVSIEGIWYCLDMNIVKRGDFSQFESYGKYFLTFEDAVNSIENVEKFTFYDTDKRCRVSLQSIKKEGYFDDDMRVSMYKVKFRGNIFDLFLKRKFYALVPFNTLGYPCGVVFASEMEAHKKGILYAMEKHPTFKQQIGRKPEVVITCNDEWLASFYDKKHGDIDWKKAFQVRFANGSNKIVCITDTERFETLL